ncbi:hypothetical protein BGZ98_004423 [Dissophora globulifera]|nr:hypothetical protein BGZ98_004423 [Dissophora globulifera]
MFLAGFLTGVVIMFSILSNAEPANGWNDTQIIYVFSSIAAGFIIGAFCFFFNRFCSFILGGIAGLTLAMYILAWRDGTLIHSRGGRIGLLVGTAGFFVIVGLFLGRRILIPASVMLGSYIYIAGLDMFARTGFTESIKLFFTTDENIVYYVTANLYIMLGAIGGLIVMGMVYQFLAWRNRRQRMVAQGRTIHSHSDDWTLLHPKKNRTIRPDPTYPDGNYPQNYNTNYAGTSTNPALGDDGRYHEKKWYKRNPFKRHPKREVDNYGDNRASYSSNAALNT